MTPRLLPLFLALAGCSMQIQGLHDAPIPLPPLPAAVGPPVSVLVCRFADKRGDKFMRLSPAGMIPMVNLFYMGETFYYADRGGFAGDTRRGHPQLMVGTLETSLPDLVAASIREARPGWPVEVTASLDRCRSGGDAQYVIDGSIRRTELRVHTSFLPLGVLALFGVPGKFVDFVGEVDVEVRDARTGRAAWSHTFLTDERRAVGLYYHRHSGRDMFSALLVDTVQRTSTGAIHVAERGT